MKNKIELKKMLIACIFIILIINILFVYLNYYEYRVYTHNFNIKLNGILSSVIEKYPDVQKNDLMKILDNQKNYDNVLSEYGINLENNDIVLENKACFEKFVKINILTMLFLAISLVITFLIYNYNKDKKLAEITEYIEKINKQNYQLDIDDNTEDELSILKNEVYKTTILLKEQTENSLNDKLNLKNSISDISHQLKTPLTSITILLDNIIENPDMECSIRNEFIKDIRREIININFLIQALLKLSKFDVNAVEFERSEVNILQMLDSAIKNVMPLCDLKKVEIKLEANEEDTLICDAKWQIEAISNILKNSVEYSNVEGTILIRANKYKLYTQIIIKDEGKGIDKEDVPHIFERFYKGKNSSKNSIGIGLALSKTIIEKDDGNILVDSKIGQGTRFVIKYFNEI